MVADDGLRRVADGPGDEAALPFGVPLDVSAFADVADLADELLDPFEVDEVGTELPEEFRAMQELLDAETPPPRGRGLLKRCRSWRFVAIDGHPDGHLPGECRACWRPCWRRSERDSVRCSRCSRELATHADDDIRIAYSADPTAPNRELIAMANDPNWVVQNVARWQIKHRLRRPREVEED